MFKLFSEMLITALYAMVVQNLIFSASYGLSESVRMAKRPKHFVMYGVTVTFFSLVTSLICFALEKIPFIAALPLRFNFIIFIFILAVVYLLTGTACKKFLYADKKFMNSLGMCAFNTLVVALPILDLKAGSNFLQTVGIGIGAGLAFTLSIFLINAGMRHIRNNPHIPEIFKGTPALFIYVSLIALSLSCISGESLFL